MKLDRNNVAGWLISFFVGALIAAGGLTLSNRTRPAPIVIEPPSPTPSPAPTATPGPMQVYVNGAVAAAAVYEMPPGSRVADAIEMAGGWTAEANTAVVNLAQPLADGAQVYVPTMDEAAAAPIPVVSNVAGKGGGETAVTDGGDLVNINTAGVDELDTLPGVGPSTAQKIIDYRQANGSFVAIDDIMNVPGIGEAKFEAIQELVTVEGD